MPAKAASCCGDGNVIGSAQAMLALAMRWKLRHTRRAAASALGALVLRDPAAQVQPYNYRTLPSGATLRR